MPEEITYRVILKDGCRRLKGAGELREGDPLWLFGGSTPGNPAPGILWRVHQVLPPVNDDEEGEIVVELWTGDPPTLA